MLLEKYNSLKLGWLHDSIFFIVAVVGVFLLFRFVIERVGRGCGCGLLSGEPRRHSCDYG